VTIPAIIGYPHVLRIRVTIPAIIGYPHVVVTLEAKFLEFVGMTLHARAGEAHGMLFLVAGYVSPNAPPNY
jgi:hypothetical protein